MPIFQEHAFRTGADEGKDLRWLHPEHFAYSRGLAAALGRLGTEQRCNGIYADGFRFRPYLPPPTISP
jgi:hypothetical protein